MRGARFPGRARPFQGCENVTNPDNRVKQRLQLSNCSGSVVVIARRLRRGNLVLVPEPSPERFAYINEIATLRSQ